MSNFTFTQEQLKRCHEHGAKWVAVSALSQPEVDVREICVCLLNLFTLDKGTDNPNLQRLRAIVNRVNAKKVGI